MAKNSSIDDFTLSSEIHHKDLNFVLEFEQYSKFKKVKIACPIRN